MPAFASHAPVEAPPADPLHGGAISSHVLPAAAPVPAALDPTHAPHPVAHGTAVVASAAATPSGLASLVIPSTSRQIEALRARGDGVPLEPRTARSMELALRLEPGALGVIRVHAGPDAWTLAQRLGAPAVLEGDDLFFQKGTYHPAGSALLTYHLRRWAARRAPGRSDALSPAALSAVHAPRGPVATAAGLPVGGADATIVEEWQALADGSPYRLFAALLSYDPLARQAVARPADEALAAALLELAPGAPPVNLATLRANGGLAQFVTTLTREALAPGVLALRERLAADVASFLADPAGWLTRAQRRGEATPGLVVDPHAVPRQQAVEFFVLRVAPHLRALARAVEDQTAVGAAFRASGMLSLQALAAVDHAPAARVLAVGVFDVGLVAVVQRGPNWWELVVGGAVHTFEDAAGAVAGQALSALIGLGGPDAQQLVRAAGADLGRILRDPVAFFQHLVAALGMGFGQFAAHLGSNVERGVLQWLTGQGGLTLPSLDAAGLLTFGLETAGLSYAAFTGDLAAAFTKRHRAGARLVAGLDTLHAYAPQLQDLAVGPGGPAGQLTALAGHLIGEVTSLDVRALVFAQVKAGAGAATPGAGGADAAGVPHPGRGRGGGGGGGGGGGAPGGRHHQPGGAHRGPRRDGVLRPGHDHRRPGDRPARRGREDRPGAAKGGTGGAGRRGGRGGSGRGAHRPGGASEAARQGTGGRPALSYPCRGGAGAAGSGAAAPCDHRRGPSGAATPPLPPPPGVNPAGTPCRRRCRRPP